MDNTKIDIICNALEEKKAFNIKKLMVSEVSSVCDCFVIASGSNKNQIQAMCDSVEDELFKADYKMKNREGLANGGWILLDFYDIIIHIFTSEMRDFYDLDHTWKDAKVL